MARLLLSRSTPITLAEASQLPVGARVDNGAHGGRIELVLPDRDLDALIQGAFALGAAVPTARLQGHDLPELKRLAPLAAVPMVPSDPQAGAAVVASAASSAAPTLPLQPTPWQLLEDGQQDQALAAFVDYGLDSDGRQKVRTLFKSTDPGDVTLACQIATVTQWRSFVTSLRGVLAHADTRVRVAAVQGVGALSGVGMIWQLQKLSEDSSPDVRDAVVRAVADIESRQR